MPSTSEELDARPSLARTLPPRTVGGAGAGLPGEPGRLGSVVDANRCRDGIDWSCEVTTAALLCVGVRVVIATRRW
jgi:hypothetical protein